MKKIAISLFALAAVSTLALAGPNSGSDPRDRDSETYIGKYPAQLENEATSSDVFAVRNDNQALSSFERMKRQAELNEIDGH